MTRFAPVLVLTLLFTGCQAAATTGSTVPQSPTTAAATTGTAAPAPLLLAGTSWVVTHIDGQPVIPAVVPTAEFIAHSDPAPDGSAVIPGEGPLVRGLTSCNYYSSQYTQDGAHLTVGITTQTAMSCLDDETMRQEAAFSAALGASATFTGDASGIVIMDAAGAERLRLAPAPVPTPKPLEGTPWQLTSFVEGDVAISLVTGTSIPLSIENGTLHAQPCNSVFGPVTIDGTSLRVGELATTYMLCTGPRGEQEQRFLGILKDVTTWAIDGDRLTLSTPDGRALVFQAGE